MQQKESAHAVEFHPDAETLEILASIGAGEQDNFINDAIKALYKQSPGRAKAAVEGDAASAAGGVNCELRRLFGADFSGIGAVDTDKFPDAVFIANLSNNERVCCGIKDALDILKSLRQPITPDEVWDILEATRME